MNTLLILSGDAPEYEDLIRDAGLGRLDIFAFEAVEPARAVLGRANIVLGAPDLVRMVLPGLDRLEWVQSTWAGIRPLAAPGLRQDYLLTNVKGIFGPIMSEYVFCYLLMHAQKALQRHASQQEQVWDRTLPGLLRDKTIGILGTGSIGQAIARTAKCFHMKTRGYSRRSGSCEFIDTHFTTGHSLKKFVQDLDFLVSTLPDTPATRNLLDREIFAAMSPKALLVNVGRGNVLDEPALVEAVNRGDLAGAVLDVFNTEPLPPAHPFWHTPGILITAHTAALGYPRDIAPIFIENYKRFSAGKSLNFLVDFDRGY